MHLLTQDAHYIQPEFHDSQWEPITSNNMSDKTSVEPIYIPLASNSFKLGHDSPDIVNYIAPLCQTSYKAYLAIIITVIPLWCIMSVLVIFFLLSFHKSLRATKIYDDCTKLNAKYSYYIELRTGDCSASYNKRRTTITIDMFDENQTSLTRIAVPAHVIFGRRNSPINPIEDEKYFELRVTRFWLFRASKLKKIATIRLTHSCHEPDAKIMVYGIQVRGNDIEDYKTFFPVMNYISAYGSASRQNACYDQEPAGSISNMGGARDETGFTSGQLSRSDYTILTYLLSSIVWFLASYKDLFLKGEEFSTILCLYRGAIIGIVSYALVFILGLFHKYYIKRNYSINIGKGIFNYIYYASCVLMILTGSVIWIITTVHAYKHICPSLYGSWILTILFAFLEIFALTILSTLIYWSVHLWKPIPSYDQYVFPDDYSMGQLTQTAPIDSNSSGRRPTNSVGYNSKSVALNPGQVWQQPIYHHNTHSQSYRQHDYSLPLTQSPLPTHLQNKTYGRNELQEAGYQFNTQDRNPSSGQPTSGKPKRSGSAESTGSTYYQQLMKNKGGVKSISQYGELMRAKRRDKDKQHAK